MGTTNTKETYANPLLPLVTFLPITKELQKPPKTHKISTLHVIIFNPRCPFPTQGLCMDNMSEEEIENAHVCEGVHLHIRQHPWCRSLADVVELKDLKILLCLSYWTSSITPLGLGTSTSQPPLCPQNIRKGQK